VQKQLLAAIARVAKGEAAAAGSPREPTIFVDPRGTTRATFNDEALTARLTAVLRRTLGDENVVPFQREMGSEDFSEYGHAGAPAVLFWVGATEPQKFAEAKAKGVSPPFQHSPNFAPDRERTIRTATTTLTISALELLGKP
jgi:hippurate hydrolase